MTYAQLLAAIKASPKCVNVQEEPYLPQHVFLRVRYYASDADQAEEIIRDEAFNVILVDYGQPTEKAFFENRKPPYLAGTPAFRARVDAVLTAYQSTHPALESYQISRCDEVAKTAQVQAYVYDSVAAKTAIKNYFIFDKAGALTIRELA